MLQDGLSKRERERDDVLSSEFVSAAQCDGALHARVNFLRASAHMQRLGQMVGEQVYGVTSESSQRLQGESTCSLHECVGDGGVCQDVCLNVCDWSVYYLNICVLVCSQANEACAMTHQSRSIESKKYLDSFWIH